MSKPIPTVEVADLWLKLDKLNDFTIADLAWITHQAEREDDDQTVIVIQNHLLTRPADNAFFREEYLRLWPIYNNTHPSTDDE